jgi:hypothetical protein
MIALSCGQRGKLVAELQLRYGGQPFDRANSEHRVAGADARNTPGAELVLDDGARPNYLDSALCSSELSSRGTS